TGGEDLGTQVGPGCGGRCLALPARPPWLWAGRKKREAGWGALGPNSRSISGVWEDNSVIPGSRCSQWPGRVWSLILPSVWGWRPSRCSRPASPLLWPSFPALITLTGTWGLLIALPRLGLKGSPITKEGQAWPGPALTLGPSGERRGLNKGGKREGEMWGPRVPWLKGALAPVRPPAWTEASPGPSVVSRLLLLVPEGPGDGLSVVQEAGSGFGYINRGGHTGLEIAPCPEPTQPVHSLSWAGQDRLTGQSHLIPQGSLRPPRRAPNQPWDSPLVQLSRIPKSQSGL
ncbi:hypothetical protein HPG69_015111, partial [Diceros bicornis minor]